MVNFTILILKMLKAIRMKHGVILLLTTEQKISERTGRVYTEYRVSLGMTVEQFDAMHPNDPKNPMVYKSKYASKLLYVTVKQEEMFRYILDEIWKPLESGEMYEKGKVEAAKFRSRYDARKRKGGGSRKGVLQDAQVGKELPGDISGDEFIGSDGEGEGDIREA